MRRVVAARPRYELGGSLCDPFDVGLAQRAPARARGLARREPACHLAAGLLSHAARVDDVPAEGGLAALEKHGGDAADEVVDGFA